MISRRSSSNKSNICYVLNVMCFGMDVFVHRLKDVNEKMESMEGRLRRVEGVAFVMEDANSTKTLSSKTQKFDQVQMIEANSSLEAMLDEKLEAYHGEVGSIKSTVNQLTRSLYVFFHSKMFLVYFDLQKKIYHQNMFLD